MNNKVLITQELLDGLELTIGLKTVSTQKEFEEILKLDRAIIYLLVDWSGPERFSRYYVYKALIDSEKSELPVFKIDCSDQKKKYIEEWLLRQDKSKFDFYFGGWGATVLVEKGVIADFVSNPQNLGLADTVEKLKKWKSTDSNTLC